jgi:hypothetical protein
MGRANRCSMSAASRRNRSIDSRVVNPRGWADTSAQRRPRCKRRDLSRWRWRGFSWPDGWPSSAWRSNLHKRSFPNPHRHSHRRPSIHRLHTLCRNRPRPPFHQDCHAPFRVHLRCSRLRVLYQARALALIGGRLQRRRHPASRKRTQADVALGITVRTGAAEVKPPVLRVFGQHVDSQLSPTVGECAVHSNPRTDVMQSGVLARIDAGAS